MTIFAGIPARQMGTHRIHPFFGPIIGRAGLTPPLFTAGDLDSFRDAFRLPAAGCRS
ncbi:MAG: hypothetical protein OEO83_18125 [Alphaproteobacteria bacterium]|nr:hypothetical protein [Alphaproteobacteria bacterium]